MNKKDYYGGRKEKFKFKRSRKFLDFNSIYNEQKEYDFELKQHIIKRVIVRNLVFFAVLFLLSFLLYCIYRLVEGN